MSDGHLRQRERDLYEAARELREEEIPEKQNERDEIVDAARRKYDGVENIPHEMRQNYQRARQELRELAGTADTYEHYAEEWADGDACVFTLEELNGDEYARTVDAVSAEAAAQARQDGSIPEGFGQVKALEFGVVDLPEGAPSDPGQWPAPVVTELFAELNDITAPSGVDLGNESLAGALSDADATTDIPAER